ncbi:hypothetical protein ACFX13_047323 [Malus domestica]
MRRLGQGGSRCVSSAESHTLARDLFSLQARFSARCLGAQILLRPKTAPKYNESPTGINYISDENFVTTGERKLVLPEYKNKYYPSYNSLRSFPEGIRKCYKINVTSKTKYLIGAGIQMIFMIESGVTLTTRALGQN